MNILKKISKEFNIPKKNLEFIDGPDTGVGVDYWVRDKVSGREFYANLDQNILTIEEMK